MVTEAGEQGTSTGKPAKTPKEQKTPKGKKEPKNSPLIAFRGQLHDLAIGEGAEAKVIKAQERVEGWPDGVTSFKQAREACKALKLEGDVILMRQLIVLKPRRADGIVFDKG